MKSIQKRELTDKERVYEERRRHDFEEESKRTQEQNETLEAVENSKKSDDEYSEFEETNYINVREFEKCSLRQFNFLL